MAEYVEKETAISACRHAYAKGLEPSQYIEIIDAADVVPVRHGRWVKLDMHHGMEQYKCTVCRSESYIPECMEYPMYAYCPNCGAKMDMEESNES